MVNKIEKNTSQSHPDGELISIIKYNGHGLSLKEVKYYVCGDLSHETLINDDIQQSDNSIDKYCTQSVLSYDCQSQSNLK
jgi:hypothetical protein